MLSQKENNVKIIVANWQMNGDFDFTYHYFKHLCECILPENLLVVVCPPVQFINLGFRMLMEHDITQICLGAQNVSSYTDNNITGDISATMLKECGAKAILVENNYDNNKNDNANNKVQNIIKEGLCPIISVTINLSQDKAMIQENISKQIDAFLQNISKLDVLMVAFSFAASEQTNDALFLQNLSSTANAIKNSILTRCKINNLFILYTGNLNGSNIHTVITSNNIDGAILTDYSLQTHKFCETLEHLNIQ